MATRQRSGDLAAAEARRQSALFGREIRAARLGLGMSIETAARRGGLSPAQHGRIERGELRRPSFEHLCRTARAVGLDASLKAYPSAAPVRDAGQLAVLTRFEAMLAVPLVRGREAALPASATSVPGMGRSVVPTDLHRSSARCTSMTSRP